MIDRNIAPPIKNAVDFHFSLHPIETWTLDNGVQVYALSAGEEEVVQLEWVFNAGNSLELKNHVAGAVSFLLKNGTSSQTALQINEHFEFYGSYLNRNCFNETSNLTLHCLSRHLYQVLPKVKELISDSIFPQEELDIFSTNTRQRLNVNLQKCDFVANREMDVLLYGKDHPYGKYTRAEDLEALTREDLLQFFDQHYRQGNCVMFVAGKLPANLQQELNNLFGKLPLKPAVTAAVSPLALPPLPTHRVHRLSVDPNGVQGAIRLARHFPNRHHPDFQGAVVLNVLLGGYFGSRLMSNIREEKGYTYGIHSYLQNHIEQSAWVISTEAGKEVCEATIAEVYYEMELLRNQPVSEEELLLVRNFMLGSILADLDGPFEIMNRWKSYILTGENEQYFYRGIENIRTITPQRLQQLAQQYLQPEAFFEMVVV